MSGRPPLFRGRIGLHPALPRIARDVLVLFLAWAFLVAVFASHFLIQRVDLKAGQIAPSDVYATHEIVNRPLTERLRRQAEDQVGPIYVTDKAALAQALKTAQQSMTKVLAMSGKRSLAGQLATLTGLKISPDMAVRILALPKQQLLLVSALTRTVLREVMLAGYRSTAPSMAAGLTQIELTADGVSVPNLAARDLLVAVAQASFRPNLVYSPSETQRARLQAASQVAPTYVVPGDLVVVKGSRVTAAQVEILRSLGLLRGRDNLGAVAGAGLLAAALLASVGLYVALAARRRALPASTPAMLSLIGAGVLLLSGLLVHWSGSLAPLATSSLLCSLLIDPGVGVVVTLLLGMALAVAFGLDVPTVTTLVVGGLAGAAGAAHASGRSLALRSVTYVLVGQVSVGLGFILLGDVSSGVGLAPWLNLGWTAAGAVLSGILAFGTLPFFESLFGILTAVRLTELVNPNQPLLSRLLMEAPGTYHHCVIVGNLAEAAAEAVGGHSLLARVGALYHDIGKLRRPMFFIDNQFGADNPHDRLAPSLSSLIITAHVKDGLELAKEAGLPLEVRRFIAEHHGTTLVQYFWRKELARHEESAASKDGELPAGVSETDFRYPGPRPHSKETAIVMLADTCEAAIRALPKPVPPRIEARVRQLIRERLTDGQLDEADLTLKDLDLIARTFTQVLSGVFHTRVPYPENERGIPDELSALPEPVPAPPTAAEEG